MIIYIIFTCCGFWEPERVDWKLNCAFPPDYKKRKTSLCKITHKTFIISPSHQLIYSLNYPLTDISKWLTNSTTPWHIQLMYSLTDIYKWLTQSPIPLYLDHLTCSVTHSLTYPWNLLAQLLIHWHSDNLLSYSLNDISSWLTCPLRMNV